MRIISPTALIAIFLISISSCTADSARGNADSTGNDTIGKITVHKASAGEIIFRQKCIACHSIDKNQSDGNDLRCVTSRMPRGDWRYRFIADPTGMIASGDEYAVKMARQFSSIMPPQALSREEIDSIFKWIDSEVPCNK